MLVPWMLTLRGHAPLNVSLTAVLWFLNLFGRRSASTTTAPLLVSYVRLALNFSRSSSFDTPCMTTSKVWIDDGKTVITSIPPTVGLNVFLAFMRASAEENSKRNVPLASGLIFVIFWNVLLISIDIILRDSCLLRGWCLPLSIQRFFAVFLALYDLGFCLKFVPPLDSSPSGGPWGLALQTWLTNFLVWYCFEPLFVYA